MNLSEYLNFETIIALLFLAISILALVTNIKRKKGLGKMLQPTLTGIKHSDFITQLTLIVMMAVFIVSSMFLGTQTDKNYLFLYVLFPIALVIYFINTLLQTITPKGFYENGVYTSNGIIMYQEIKEYDIMSLPKRGIVRFRINPKPSILSSTSYIDVEPQNQGEAKSYLKKNASFKKNSYTPPPKKKRKR